MLIILFNLIIILAFATRVMLMIQRTNEPENEMKRRQVDVHVEKGDDD